MIFFKGIHCSLSIDLSVKYKLRFVLFHLRTIIIALITFLSNKMIIKKKGGGKNFNGSDDDLLDRGLLP
jgi:hypothetical protein